MRSAQRLALVTVLALCPVAHADTIFNFSATFNGVPFRGYPPSSQVTGTLTIDTVQGVVTGASIQSVVTNFFYVNFSESIGDHFVIEIVNLNPPFPPLFPEGGISDLDILLPVSSLVGYTGGLGCSETAPSCPTANSEQVWRSVLMRKAQPLQRPFRLARP
jgi:hypothetical protein